MRTPALIYGTGGHARSVAETAVSAGYSMRGFVGHSDSDRLLGYPIVRSIPDEHLAAGGIVIVAIGKNDLREQVLTQLLDDIPISHFPAVRHESASVSRFAAVDSGSVVMQNAVVASGARVGRGCLINSGSVLEHDSVMNDFSSLAPNATTGGKVVIGDRAIVSMSVAIKDGVGVGPDALVGAGSYVNADIPPFTVAYGTPARAVRLRKSSDGYF